MDNITKLILLLIMPIISVSLIKRSFFLLYKYKRGYGWKTIGSIPYGGDPVIWKSPGKSSWMEKMNVLSSAVVLLLLALSLLIICAWILLNFNSI